MKAVNWLSIFVAVHFLNKELMEANMHHNKQKSHLWDKMDELRSAGFRQTYDCNPCIGYESGHT